MAERIKAPVASTLMGIGAFQGPPPILASGPTRVYAANRAVEEADLLILLGARMG